MTGGRLSYCARCCDSSDILVINTVVIVPYQFLWHSFVAASRFGGAGLGREWVASGGLLRLCIERLMGGGRH